MILKFTKKLSVKMMLNSYKTKLNNLFISRNDNGMILNIDKFATVSFSLKKKKKAHYLLTTALITYICPVKILLMI